MVICLPFLLRLPRLFRANTTVLREANVISPALRESKFALARPLFAGAELSDLLPIFWRVLAGLRTLRGAVQSVSEA